MLCYALAGAERDAAIYMWGFAVILELHADLFLAVSLNDNLQVPCRLNSSMDRFWAIVLAPLGAMAIMLFTKSRSSTQNLFMFSAIILMTVFALLYFGLKEAVCSRMSDQSFGAIHRSILLLLLKLLGWTIWTVSAWL